MEKRYIQTFETSESLREALNNSELGKPYVAYLEDEQRIVWNEVPEPPAPDYSSMPLTFEILSGGYIYWVTDQESQPEISIQYSLNGGPWEEMPWQLGRRDGDTLHHLNAGDIVQFRGNNQSYEGTHLLTSTGVADYNIYGNIMSLVDSTGYTGVTSVAPSAFAGLFSAPSESYVSLVHSAEHLVLPATTLANGCYRNMFQGCALLTEAPELPAATLVAYCYSSMFLNCTSLNYVKCLATNWDPDAGLTDSWLSGVAATGTFVKHPNAAWRTDVGGDGIPAGWTVIDATI